MLPKLIDDRTSQICADVRYHVCSETQFTLHIGQVSEDLLMLHKRYRTTSSMFITGLNPVGRTIDTEANAGGQRALKQELEWRSLSFIEGFSEHPDFHFPFEESFLVFGLTLVAAKVLAERFEQTAILWAEADAVPRLVVLRTFPFDEPGYPSRGVFNPLAIMDSRK